MKQLFLLICITILTGVVAYGQSRDESSPTPVSGTTIRATLIDDATDGYQIYYYSMNLAAGTHRATIRSRTRECNGANVSVYVNGTANVSTASCDIPSNTSTGEYDFDVETAGNKVIAIYVTGGTNERFEIELAFSGGGPAVVGSGKDSGVVITPVEPGNGANPGTVVVADEAGTSPAGTADKKIETGAGSTQSVPGLACQFEDGVALSNFKRTYNRIFGGIIFRPGKVRISVSTQQLTGSTAPITGASPASGTITLSPFTTSAFEPGIAEGRWAVSIPLNNRVLKVLDNGHNGQGQIKVQFRQNANQGTRNIAYSIVIRGEAIVECGPDARQPRQVTPIDY